MLLLVSVYIIMKEFLVGRKRDLLHHVSRGMRLGRHSPRRPYRDLGDILLTRSLQRNLSLAKRALAEKGTRNVLRRMRRHARSQPVNLNRVTRLRNERQLDALAARQNEAIRQYWNNMAQRGGNYIARALGGGAVPALQAAWRNRHTRAVPAGEQYRNFVGYNYQ